MKRVAVVGCPGAGKTTFVRVLAKKTKLPPIHLDTYYHDKTKAYYEASDLDAWVAKANELSAKERWIMDGNFGATFNVRFARADTVIFFDYSRYLCFWRILKRRVKYHSLPRPEMPQDWEEKFDYGFLRYVWNFKSWSRPKLLAALEGSNVELIIFKKPRDAEAYLKSIKKPI